MVVFDHLIMKKFMISRSRSYLLALTGSASLFLTSGCVILGGKPPVKHSDSTITVTRDSLTLGTNQEFYYPTNEVQSSFTNNLR